MVRRAFVAAGLLLVVGSAGVAGCGGPTVVSVAVRDGTATLANGDILRVDLGEYNNSVGDKWFVVTPPDAAVLDDKGQDFDADDCPEGHSGCGGTLAWEFAAVGKGSATIVFRYCYRSNLDDCDPGPGRGPAEPVRLAVTVQL